MHNTAVDAIYESTSIIAYHGISVLPITQAVTTAAGLCSERFLPLDDDDDNDVDGGFD